MKNYLSIIAFGLMTLTQTSEAAFQLLNAPPQIQVNYGSLNSNQASLFIQSTNGVNGGEKTSIIRELWYQNTGPTIASFTTLNINSTLPAHISILNEDNCGKVAIGDICRVTAKIDTSSLAAGAIYYGFGDLVVNYDQSVSSMNGLFLPLMEAKLDMGVVKSAGSVGPQTNQTVLKFRRIAAQNNLVFFLSSSTYPSAPYQGGGFNLVSETCTSSSPAGICSVVVSHNTANASPGSNYTTLVVYNQSNGQIVTQVPISIYVQ